MSDNAKVMRHRILYILLLAAVSAAHAQSCDMDGTWLANVHMQNSTVPDPGMGLLVFSEGKFILKYELRTPTGFQLAAYAGTYVKLLPDFIQLTTGMTFYPGNTDFLNGRLMRYVSDSEGDCSSGKLIDSTGVLPYHFAIAHLYRP